MSKSSIIKLGRIGYMFIYLLINLYFTLSAMNDTSGSAGPFGFAFSWGSLCFFLIIRFGSIITRFIRIPEETPAPASFQFIFLATIGLLALGYLLSILYLNKEWSGVQRKFPYLTTFYHFAGVASAYALGLPYSEEAGKSWLIFFLYPIMSALAVLYIYLDWRLVRKIVSLEKAEKERIAKDDDISKQSSLK